MKYNISDYRLKVIVDELGEEYKDLLIERILDDMREIDADQINPSDLIRLDVSTKSSLRNNRKTQQKNRMLSMVSLLGVTYAILGLMLLLWSEFQDAMRYNTTMMMAVVLIFIGLFVVLFSLLFKSMVRMRPQNYRGPRHTVSSYEVVNKWKEIEALIHQLTPEENVLSLASMLSNLKETKIISDKDIETINRLLSIRNQVVHEQDKIINLSQSELRSIFIEANKIISKMKKIV